MNVLSLFDGISCAYEGFNRAGVKVANYYACEIEKNATIISNKRHQGIHRPVNDVRELRKDMLPHIDFLVGGSPCTDLSIAKKDREGLEGKRSSLFWEYVRLKNELNPKYFILENVASMPKKDKDIITKEMGVEPVMFNASLVSAQSRKRLFWTNISFELPADKGILLKDILQPDAEVDERMVVKGKAYCLTATYNGATETNSVKRKQRTMVKVGYIGEGEQYGQGGQAHRVYSEEGKTPTLSSYAPLIKLGHIGNSNSQGNRVYDPAGKSCTLSANGGGLGAKTGLYQISKREEDALRDVNDKARCMLSSMYKGSQSNGMTLVNTGKIRKLTPIECERLMGLPDNYTEGVANTNRYKVLGNAFNVDVIAHILSSL
jgi:DNA (cytosine-5)-methyltransferase 3A